MSGSGLSGSEESDFCWSFEGPICELKQQENENTKQNGIPDLETPSQSDLRYLISHILFFLMMASLSFPLKGTRPANLEKILSGKDFKCYNM